MNKILYFFILLILLNQSLSEDCEGGDVTKCNELTPKDNEGVCFKGTDACKVAKSCNEVTSGASEEMCQNFLAQDPTNKCSFIAANADENIVAHCESTLRACTEAVDGITLNSNICSSRTTNSIYCFFDGQSSCKQATSCAEIKLSSDTTKALCSHYNAGDKLCVPDGKTCILKTTCNKAKKTNEHECSYYPVVGENKECALKDGSETDCEEKDKTQTTPDQESGKDDKDNEKEGEGEKDDGKTEKNSSQVLNLSLALLLLVFAL